MWSKKYRACVMCGQNNKPLGGGGKCRPCYRKQYDKDHKEQIKNQKHDYYIRFIQGTDRQKIARERWYFDSKREEVIQRDNYQCVKCGAMGIVLVVHHKDGLGRNAKAHHNEVNNLMNNLETLCQKCHVREHHIGLYRKIKTHCAKGHPYSEENTYIVPAGNGRWKRCRICTNATARESWKKVKERSFSSQRYHFSASS